MLVLSRKVRERIIISSDITITVVAVRGNKVKVGIDAPGDVPVHREEVAAAVITGQAYEIPGTAMQNQKLLVVSNNPDARSSIANVLAEEGNDVDTAHSSRCALEYSDEQRYDVAIIDESLSHARGQEVFERMKGHQRGLRGILCADRPTVATVEAALDSGMHHVIQKPVDHSELVELVNG